MFQVLSECCGEIARGDVRRVLLLCQPCGEIHTKVLDKIRVNGTFCILMASSA